MTTKTKTQLGLIITLVLFALALIFSQNANPDFPPLFSLKRIQEKAYLSLKNKPEDRVDYLSSLLNKRLAELDSQIRRQSYDYILPSSLRYSALAGQITDLVIANNLTDKVDSIKKMFLDHQKVLHNLDIIYPKNTDNWEWKYIQDDINYLKLYLDKLSGR